MCVNTGKDLGGILIMESNRSTRILVVDDEADSARIVAEAIAGWGFEVVIASNGREGLNVLRSTPIDGILLDLEMPVMNGWTMLDELRWQGCEVPVIVMSKEANHSKLRKLLEEGAQDYVVKACNPHLLLQKLLRHFSRRRAVEKRPVLEKNGVQRAGLYQAKRILVA
jgi:DNA-binding response OmpR family regulator